MEYEMATYPLATRTFLAVLNITPTTSHLCASFRHIMFHLYGLHMNQTHALKYNFTRQNKIKTCHNSRPPRYQKAGVSIEWI